MYLDSFLKRRHRTMNQIFFIIFKTLKQYRILQSNRIEQSTFVLLWIYLSLVSVIDILYASLNLFFNKSHSMFVWRIRSNRFLLWRPDLVIVINAGLSIFISLLVLMWHYNTSCCYSFPFRHTLTYKYWTHDYDNRYCCSFCWLSINQPNNVIQQWCLVNWIKSLEFTFFSFLIPICIFIQYHIPK